MSAPSGSVSFDLMPEEEVLLQTRPHPLAMFSLMLFWLLLGSIGATHLAYHDNLTRLVTALVDRPLIMRDVVVFATTHAHDVVWLVALAIPLLTLAIFRINFGYVLTLGGLIVVHVLLRWKAVPDFVAPAHATHIGGWLLIIVGCFGVVCCELFRRSHRYYLTNQRIVARFGTLQISERSTLYSKIDDLVLQSGLFGRIFGYGTVIPITASGLGMGHNMAIGGVGAGGGAAGVSAGMFAGGGKAENVTRDKSIYVLYRIPQPAAARNLIMQEMTARERPRLG